MTHDTDFHAWALEQARRLRTGEPIDAENIAEELESLSGSQEHQLESRLIVLLTHLLKCEFQAQKRTRSWDLSIQEQRRRIARLFQKMPSLRPKLEEAIADAYETAVIRASDETGLVVEDFPSRCAYSVEEILEQPLEAK